MITLRRLCGLVLGVCFFQAGAAFAQTPPPRDLRLVEHAIELGWMADPITFPYELRAMVRGGVCEIHGVVPDLTVRKQAINIARLHFAKTLDQTDLAPGCEKAFVAVPAERVASTAQAAVGKALPQLARIVTATCNPDGVVTLTGAVSSHAEKTTLSELMRRVPGCLRVENVVHVGAPDMPPPATQQTAYNVPQPPLATPPNEADVKQPQPTAASDQIRDRIAKLCPRATGVSVSQTGPGRFLIRFTAPNNAAASQMATLIFNQDDWKQFHLDIGANVPR